MNFLLVLSAVLSAVTGAFAGARAPDARPHQQAMAQVVSVARASATVAVPATRIAAAPAWRVPARIERRPVSAPAAMAPLYADRLIE
jgi:hypothetical protein